MQNTKKRNDARPNPVCYFVFFLSHVLICIIHSPVFLKLLSSFALRTHLIWLILWSRQTIRHVFSVSFTIFILMSPPISTHSLPSAAVRVDNQLFWTAQGRSMSVFVPPEGVIEEGRKERLSRKMTARRKFSMMVTINEAAIRNGRFWNYSCTYWVGWKNSDICSITLIFFTLFRLIVRVL